MQISHNFSNVANFKYYLFYIKYVKFKTWLELREIYNKSRVLHNLQRC